MATKEVTFLNYTIDDSNNVYFYQNTVEATVLTGSETTLSAGWYVVDKNISLEQTLTISGDVKLILSDGCSYAVTKGTDVNGSLTIYGQSSGTGSFSSAAASQKSTNAGIELNEGTLTVVGGNVSAIGTSQAAGIGSSKGCTAENITIYGGNINATAGDKAAAIGSGDDGLARNITIYSGVVTANGPYQYGAGIGGGDGHSGDTDTGTYKNITIYGGEITATGGEKAAGIGSGATSGRGGTITINGGNISATTPQKSITKQSGAGIGGGGDSSIDGVVINGGTVNASTGNISSIGAGTDGSCSKVTVNGDMTLTANGSTVSHTTGENIVSKLSGSQSAAAAMQNKTISDAQTVTEAGTHTYTQSGSYYGNGGYNYIKAAGSLTISTDPITGEEAIEDISFQKNVVNNSLAKGGAIYNEGTLTLNNYQSKDWNFTGNKAIGNSEGAQGGAIYNAAGATASISSVDFADNYATCCKNESVGGAIYNAKDATLTLDNVTFSGNKATTAGGAIYNAGTLNLNGGEITLSTSTDTLYNAGTMNWNSETDVKVVGYELVTNAADSKRVITISSARESGIIEYGYTIAEGDFSNVDLSGLKFTLTGIDGRQDVTLTVDGGACQYGGDTGIMYALVTGTSDGKDTLTLKAVNTNKILVTTGEKWFKESTDTTSPSYPAEAITISGIVTGDIMNRITVSGYGESATVEVGEDKKWSVTLPYAGTAETREGETAGTTLTITGYNADAETISTTEYTLKVDTVDPTLNYSVSDDGYVKEGGDTHWYKQGAEVTYSATATDDTSKVRITKISGEPYEGGTLNLDTSIETPEEMWLVFAAQDNAGNTTMKEFNYQIDGTGPVVSEAAFVVGKEAAYVDDNGVAWFQQGAADAALKAVIADNLSGLKDATAFSGTKYADGKFAIDTTAEQQVVSSDIEAIDNVGNTSESEERYSYGVDGTGPVIGDGTFEGKTLYVDGNGKSWFKKGDTTAALVIDITDDLSGLASASFAGAAYEDGKFMLADAVPTEDCKITATDNVGNVSEKSQTAAGIYYKLGIDAEGPTITVSTVPATDLTDGTVTVTVKAADTESGVYSVGYSFDDNEWTWLSGDTATFTVDQNKLVYVAAYDNVYNKTKDTYQVANICAKTNADYVAIADRTVTVAAGDEYRLNSLTLEEDSSFTLGADAKVFAKTVEMKGGTLDATEGTMLSETLKVVSGTDNELVGVVKDSRSVSNVVVANGAALTVSKDQFDSLMQFTDYASAGKLFVSAVEGNALTENDIKALIGKTAAGTVDFVKQDLVDIHKLTITDDKISLIGFQNGYGTAKSDTLRFSKNSNTVFGKTGYEIDLKEGSNKIQVDKNAALVMKAGLTNVSTVKIEKNAVVELQAEVDFASGRNASLKTGNESSVAVADITAAASNDKLSTGKSSTFSADSISGVETISLGAYSKTTIAGCIENTETSIEGTKKLSISNGKEGSVAALKAAGEITGTAANDSFSFGNWNEVDLAGIDFGDGNDKLSIGKYSNVEIDSLDFGDGTKDKLSIGKGASLTVATLDVKSLDTLSMSKDALLCLGTQDQVDAAQEKWSKYADQIKLA